MRDKIIDNGNKDLVPKKVFTDTKYPGKVPLTCFFNDLMIETLTRERWNESLYVKIKPGAVNLHNNHTVVSEK